MGVAEESAGQVEYLLFIIRENKSNINVFFGVRFQQKSCEQIHIWSVINWAIKCKVLNKLFGDFQKSCGQALREQAFP